MTLTMNGFGQNYDDDDDDDHHHHHHGAIKQLNVIMTSMTRMDKL